MPIGPAIGAPERLPARLWLVPALSVMGGSLLTMAPYIADVPLLPSFGLVMLLGWRLLRPELWGAWVGLPLGLADDLIGGAPLGSAMTVWTVLLLLLDIADHRLLWRDHAMDWLLAALLLAGAGAAAWGISSFTGGAGPFWPVGVQALLSILIFPMAARLCRMLDRWRLGGGQRLAR